MNTRSFMGRLAFCGLVLAQAAAALPQNPDAVAPGPRRDQGPDISPVTSVQRGSLGLVRRGDGFFGEGPDYQALFEKEGFAFIPRSADTGTAASTPPRLRFRLQSVARRDAAGGSLDVALVSPVMSADGRTVHYRRTDFVESYQLTPDGVEVSYTLSAIPPGEGDLVVRGGLATELPLVHSAADAIRFERDGVAGVEIGRVKGIDARGATVEGALRYENGVLEMSLPAAFVRGASLPLVLDPLIGSTTTLPLGNDDTDPDVAYDHDNAVYLVVWRRVPFGLRGQRVNSDGTLRGSTLFIRNGDILGPRVANVHERDGFAVVWEESNDIWGTSVDAATGAVSTPIALATGTDLQRHPDVGGEATLSDDDAVVVWWNATDSKIRGRQLTITSSGAPGLTGGIVDITDGTHTEGPVAIAQSGGSTGRYLVCWQREDLVNFDTDIQGAIVDRNLTILDDWVAIATTDDDEDDPACDGDGTCWVVSYETSRTIVAEDDIACRPVCYHPGIGAGYVGGVEVQIEIGPEDEQNPSVAWLGRTALVGFSDGWPAPLYVARVQSVDPLDCVGCGWQYTLETSSEDQDFVMMASQHSGAGTGDEALVVWQSRDTVSGDRDLKVRRFQAEDGVVTDLGFACGAGGGNARVGCARSSYASFDMWVRHATPSTQAVLILSAERGDYPCGSCTLVPDLFRSFAIPALNTDAVGNTRIWVYLPSASLVGMHFYMQWAIAGSACSSMDFSNALRVEFR